MGEALREGRGLQRLGSSSARRVTGCRAMGVRNMAEAIEGIDLIALLGGDEPAVR